MPNTGLFRDFRESYHDLRVSDFPDGKNKDEKRLDNILLSALSNRTAPGIQGMIRCRLVFGRSAENAGR
jgi:hypothetical protein